MEKLTDFFKMLSDETRLRILVLLHHRELCVCQLTGITGISQPNISKHLAKLRDMGFVRDERKEQYTFYYLDLEHEQDAQVLQIIADNIREYPKLKLDIEKSRAADRFIELMSANSQESEGDRR